METGLEQERLQQEAELHQKVKEEEVNSLLLTYLNIQQPANRVECMTLLQTEKVISNRPLQSEIPAVIRECCPDCFLVKLCDKCLLSLWLSGADPAGKS